MKKTLLIICLACMSAALHAEDGYNLWLRYNKLSDAAILQTYSQSIKSIYFKDASATISIAKQELIDGLSGLLGKPIKEINKIEPGCLVISKKNSSYPQLTDYTKLGNEGFAILNTTLNGTSVIAITANNDIGILYGVYHFLRLIQTQQPIKALNIVSVPTIQNRILNHWDNLNRTVERGYAGASIWKWHELPDYIDQRYIDYARANASIGINGTVLTNVNANALVLTKDWLLKVKALADIFRPYGIKVYLTARFSAPIEIGGLKTADPLEAEVQDWWKKKCDEIYSYIPDFGGFVVKANSEGQPGPQSYNRTHAEGANMFADALAPHNGIVMWRAFVYDVRVQKDTEHFAEGNKGEHGTTIASDDRFKQAYVEFKPLDGKFRKNVLLQVKNGPIDFQPREPFSPLFGAMQQTPLMMEFQLTQEYLGQGTHMVFEAPLFKEVLEADTYAKGKGSTVAKASDGSLYNHSISAIAGVSNIGNEKNWTNHPFAQANWYAYGRLAWNYDLSSAQIAEEWIRQTFSNNNAFVSAIKNIMLSSRETMVNYMTPLGLNHIMGTSHHYGPAPWVDDAGRADWNPIYYHRADSVGIGFDRTVKGSNALEQYFPEVQNEWNNINTCDEKFLLWFHHVPWRFKMKSGKTLWEEICYLYNAGVDSVRGMQNTWQKMEKYVDKETYQQVKMLLTIQEKEAVWWRNACLLYFQTFSKMPIPAYIEKTNQTLDYYKSLRFRYAPGIGGNL